MKISTLKKALEQLATSDPEQAEDALQALASISSVNERFQDKYLWHEEVFVLPAGLFNDMLIELLYDTYGNRKKIHGDNMEFHLFAYDVRQDCRYGSFTDEQLQFGYDIISSLWADNEAEGNHAADGSYE
jgi:hypothetical protein